MRTTSSIPKLARIVLTHLGNLCKMGQVMCHKLEALSATGRQLNMMKKYLSLRQERSMHDLQLQDVNRMP